MDKNTLEKLDYYRLKDIVKTHCVSGLGEKLIDNLKPTSNIKQVKRMLNETSEGRNLLDIGYHIPLEGIFDVTNLIEKIDKGASLEASDLTMMSNFLRGCRKIKTFIKDKEGYAPTLSAYGENISDLSYIEEEINISIKGNRVDSNATKQLKKIRRNIDNCEEKIRERLEKFLKSDKNRKCIQEFFISKRNDKYTVPIKASYKNKIEGNIIETSSKGTTVFIEPKSIDKYVTELNVLKAEESIEEYKVLATLTELLFEREKDLKINIDVISEYDMILAKAKYSKEINGVAPKLNNYGYLNIVEGKYPLISNPVSLNVNLGRDFRSLIITGPNAGGKTVVLKTIGLLTLAIQSGFHITCRKNTEMAVFDNIYVDIGDNQSIENSLSTFSSHVKNLAYILKNSSKSTLLLFDEIGSGTEPNEGAALAIALLEKFYHKGCITVASTHYGEIKNFSYKHPDFENAAMEFKKDSLEPTYRLKVGRSGDSNALYISKKMGIANDVLEKAKEYIKNKKYDYTLVDYSKLKKNKDQETKEDSYSYKMGDKVLLIEKNESAIVYKERDELNNIVVFYNKEFLKVNYKRVKLELTCEKLYPKGYDLNQLFTSFKERKLEKDIKRGSKKALKKIRKEIEK